MADTQMTLVGERAGRTVLKGSVADGAVGTHGETFILPATLGDVMLHEVNLLFNNIDVILTDVTLHGVLGYIFHVASGATLDMVDTVFWKRLYSGANALAVACNLRPTEPILWQAVERLYLAYYNPDTDATPTGDLTVFCRVRRITNP